MVRAFQSTLKPLRPILGKFLKVSRGTIATVAIVVFCASLASVTAPYLFSRIIDSLGSDSGVATLAWGFLIYSLLLGVAVALQQMVQYLSLMSSENLAFIAGTAFFGRIVRKQASFFIDHNPAEITSALARGQGALGVFVQLGLIAFIPGVTQIALSLAVLGAVINFAVVIVVVVYGAAFIALSYIANNRARKHLDAAINATQDNARFVGNAISTMESLRHFGADHWMNDRFGEKARVVFENWKRFSLHRAAYAGLFGAALSLQFGITFMILMPQYRAGLLSVGDIVLFNALLLQLNQPFEMIGYAIDEIVRSHARFLPFAYMWSAPEEAEPVSRARLPLLAGELRFDRVSYAYDNGRGVEDISFMARPGRITFIIGETGSGKSTAFRLALKSLEPQLGRISIDGVNLSELSRADWFAEIGIVPQDAILLNESLRANIVLGRDYDIDSLRAAAGKAAILDFVEHLPDGFETTVGERGLKLSGGERQRVAIARALYANPRFLFLDEASSALDETTERQIIDHVRILANDITVLAITHRKSIIRVQDNVVAIQ